DAGLPPLLPGATVPTVPDPETVFPWYGFAAPRFVDIPARFPVTLGSPLKPAQRGESLAQRSEYPRPSHRTDGVPVPGGLRLVPGSGAERTEPLPAQGPQDPAGRPGRPAAGHRPGDRTPGRPVD